MLVLERGQVQVLVLVLVLALALALVLALVRVREWVPELEQELHRQLVYLALIQ